MTANPSDDPCADDSASLLNVGIPGLIDADAASASTDATPDDPNTPVGVGDNAAASAHLAGVTITDGHGHTLVLNVADSEAHATCARPNGAQPVLTGQSSVVRVNADGSTDLITTPVDIPLGSLVVHLNRQVKTSSSITQQAVSVTNGGASVLVVGESVADFKGTPCSPPPPTCNGKLPTIRGAGTINGTPGDDVIVGSSGDDTINGLGGNDTLCGLRGLDKLNGGDGNDWATGNRDGDIVHGDDGNDTVIGGGGLDQTYGDAGDDLVKGRDDADNLWGGDGNDTLRGANGDDTLNGGSGVDTLEGMHGNDVLNGDDGDDRLDGGSGDDTINGAKGADLLFGRDGNDLLNGGIGDDTLRGGQGNDAMDGGPDRDTCDGDGQVDTAANCEKTTAVP